MLTEEKKQKSRGIDQCLANSWLLPIMTCHGPTRGSLTASNKYPGDVCLYRGSSSCSVALCCVSGRSAFCASGLATN